MIPLLLFTLDFLLYALMGSWVVSTLFVYFTIKLVLTKSPLTSWRFFYVPLVLLLLQDCFTNDRFGLALFYVIPMIYGVLLGRQIMLRPKVFLPYIFVTLAVIMDVFVIKKMLFCKNISYTATLFKIFVTIITTYTMLVGIQGSRFLSGFYKRHKKRKVWTPNRKDAS